jgi:hypothetical protein
MGRPVGAYRRHLRIVGVVSLWLVLVSCGASTSGGSDSESSAGLTPPLNHRACEPGSAPYCADDGGLLECEDQTWTWVNCELACHALDPRQCSRGCLVDDTGHACACTEDGALCSEPIWECEGGDALVGRFTGERIECLEFCDDRDAVLLGCGFDLAEGVDACRCVEAGEACDSAASVCVGEELFFGATESVATCVDGVWEVARCDAECMPEPTLGCDDGMCFCGSP